MLYFGAEIKEQTSDAMIDQVTCWTYHAFSCIIYDYLNFLEIPAGVYYETAAGNNLVGTKAQD